MNFRFFELLPFSTGPLVCRVAKLFSRGRCKSDLALECGVVGINAMSWTAEHPNAGHDVSAARTILEGETIGTPYGLRLDPINLNVLTGPVDEKLQ